MSKFPDHQAVVLTGHNGPVHCVTFSAGSGSYVLTGSADRTVRLFNPSKKTPNSSSQSSVPSSNPASRAAPPATGTLVQTFSEHAYEVLDLCVTADNARFASVGGDRRVFLWDVTSATTLRRWTGHTARVNAVTFGGVGGDDVVISGSFDATVRVWDTRSNASRPVQTFEDARDSVTSLFVREAEIVAGCGDGWVRTYDLRMGQMQSDCIGAPVTSVSLTRDGEAMIVSSLDDAVRLFDRKNGKCLREFKGHKNDGLRIRSCLGMNDAVVVTGSEDGSIWAWDVVSGEVVKRIERPHAGKVMSAVAWNAGGGRRNEWASAGGDGTVIVWEAAS